MASRSGPQGRRRPEDRKRRGSACFRIAGGNPTITNNYGQMIHGSADGAQLAWGNRSVHQTQSRTEQIAPGFEAIAQAVAKTLE